MAPKRSLRSAAAAGVLLVALAGCGSDSEPEAADSAGGAAGATGNAIEVKDLSLIHI